MNAAGFGRRGQVRSAKVNQKSSSPHFQNNILFPLLQHTRWQLLTTLSSSEETIVAQRYAESTVNGTISTS